MNSDLLKNKILNYFRFKRNYYLCGTEIRYSYVSDILVCNDKEIIEIEIKISYSDFIKDFKKIKHKIINNEFPYLDANKFYFCIPSEIKEKCLKYLKENNLPYGLISFNGVLNIIKTCKKLNDLSLQLFNQIKRKIILRLSSEMVFLRNHQKCENCGHINKFDISGKVFI